MPKKLKKKKAKKTKKIRVKKTTKLQTKKISGQIISKSDQLNPLNLHDSSDRARFAFNNAVKSREAARRLAK